MDSLKPSSQRHPIVILFILHFRLVAVPLKYLALRHLPQPKFKDFLNTVTDFAVLYAEVIVYNVKEAEEHDRPR